MQGADYNCIDAVKRKKKVINWMGKMDVWVGNTEVDCDLLSKNVNLQQQNH